MLEDAAFESGQPKQAFALYVYLAWRFKMDALPNGYAFKRNGKAMISAAGDAVTMRIPFSTLLDWTSLTPAAEAIDKGKPRERVTEPVEKALEWLTQKGLLASWELRDGRGNGGLLGGHGDGIACGLGRLLGLENGAHGRKTKAQEREAWLVYAPSEHFADFVFKKYGGLRAWLKKCASASLQKEHREATQS